MSKSNDRHSRLTYEWPRSYWDEEEKEKAMRRRRYLEQISTRTITVIPGDTKQSIPVVSFITGLECFCARFLIWPARLSAILANQTKNSPSRLMSPQLIARPQPTTAKSRQLREKKVTEKEKRTNHRLTACSRRLASGVELWQNNLSFQAEAQMRPLCSC